MQSSKVVRKANSSYREYEPM